MKPLDSFDIKLCQMQGRIFEESVKRTNYSSPIFIRRFMFSKIAKSFDDKSYLFQSITPDETYDLLDEEFGKSEYGKTKYSEDQMFWIGYIYRCIAIKYNLASKVVYNLFNAREIVKYYNIGHTFDIVQAAERMMENINYEFNIEEKSLNYMRELMILEGDAFLIGEEITVCITIPFGHKHNGITYELNYGYIKEFKSRNGNKLNAYVLGVKEPVETFKGKIIAIIHRLNDCEDKLIVSDINKDYTNKEIEDMVKFQEANFKHKIIR